MSRRKDKERFKTQKAFNRVTSKQWFVENKKVLTGLRHLANSGISKLERQHKGKTWSKVNRNKNWQSWSPSVKLAYKMGLINKHDI